MIVTEMADNIIYVQQYHAPCGSLMLGSSGDRLCLCNWLEEKHPGRVDRRIQSTLDAVYRDGGSDVTIEAANELDEYFAGQRTAFDVPLLFLGSGFQERVWRGLLDIPYGYTVTYGEFSCLLGMPSAVRAVANANGANAISIFAPCHRVIGSNGSLTGYGGGLAAKKFLLELESRVAADAALRG